MKKNSFTFLMLAAFISLITMSFTFPKTTTSNVVWTQVVKLDAEQANTDSESMGIAIFRLTSDMKLHYRINIQKLDDGDMLSAAHIHYGASGSNGGVLVGLAGDPGDFNKNKTIQLNTEQYNELLNEFLYVNVHTDWYPMGSIRGQIR